MMRTDEDIQMKQTRQKRNWRSMDSGKPCKIKGGHTNENVDSR